LPFVYDVFYLYGVGLNASVQADVSYTDGVNMMSNFANKKFKGTDAGRKANDLLSSLSLRINR
jgi:hypothetical protein